MSISISGSTAISGLSGMDTNFDTVLEQLYTVEKTQLNQLQAWRSDWQLRYDAFNTVIDQMSAAKQMLSNIGSVNNFVTKNAVSSDEKVLTAVATGSAANGQHKIVVDSMANNAIWCNTGATFAEKADIINKTGDTVQFAFDYAGKHYTYDIAANTTLESFASIINNSSKNPGITVSIINTGQGYVFQIAGKSTGEENSLTVYSCNLEGMDISNATSLWSSDTTLDPTASITNPTSYTYTATLNSGTKVSIKMQGDATQEELGKAIQNSAGSGLITYSIDASGNLVLDGVKNLTRKVTGSDAYTPAGYKLSATNLSSALVATEESDPVPTLSVTISLDDGSTRQFDIAGSATRKDFLNQVKQAVQSSANLATSGGTTSLSLSNVTDITVAGYSDLSTLGLTGATYAAEGTADATSTTITAATTTLTFNQDKLSARIDGKSDSSAEGSTLRYTLLKADGTALYVDKLSDGATDLTSDVSNSDLLEAIKAKFKKDLTDSGISYTEDTLDGVTTLKDASGNVIYTQSTDSDGNTALAINGIKTAYLSTGTSGTSGFTISQDITTQINVGSFSPNTALSCAQDDLTARIDGLSSGSAATALTYTLTTSAGTSIQVNINSDATNNDLFTALKQAADANNLTYTETTDSDNNTVITFEGVESIASSATSSAITASTVRYLEAAPDLTYTLVFNAPVEDASGEPISSITQTFKSGTSLNDIKASLENELSTLGISDITLSWVDSEGNAADGSTEAYLKVTNVQAFSGPGFKGQIVESSNWNITNSSNAVYHVDNWPMTMQSASNTITDLLDGVSITLQGVGESNLTISTDVTSVETSIQNFLDAVNSVLYTIRELTAVDEDKEITSNDPNDIGNSNYSKSTLTSEKGGLLTGNYGVQLVKSRFISVVTGTPPGFQAMTTADDLLSGDILSCLSNLGVKTDTDSTSETYGLLVIAPRSDYLQELDSENYEDMINNHINELVDFFVSEGTGTSSTADFRYNSHVSGITEAGTYDVSYTVDDSGHISNVTIGGEPCQRDESRGGYYYTCSAGAARGLAISIDDLTEGSHTGQVRIKQGLVQTVKSFLDKELKYNDVNISANAPADVIDAQLSLKSENGAMMTLKSNYAKIMSNIDNSISKEQTRLETWYNRQKTIFANLETLLSELNAQQESLESQLKQLGNS